MTALALIGLLMVFGVCILGLVKLAHWAFPTSKRRK